MKKAAKILAVDDEEFNLDILKCLMLDAGYDVVEAEDGMTTLRRLEQNPDVDVILLDRMMPNMDGMEVVKRIKADARFRDIPVIMQTAAAASDQVLEGLKAGVYYYLTKPYEDVMLLAIVKAALEDATAKREMKQDVRNQRRMLGLMQKSLFHFRTLEDTKTLAYFIANCFPDPELAVFGLNELLINAVEHGNLGITYSEKTRLMLDGCWQHEIERRLSQEANKHKFATLEFKSTAEEIAVHIRDEGKGFDWHKYIELSPDRATDPHGRGIATSRMISFDSVQYLGTGNEVLCKVHLNSQSRPNNRP